MMTAIRKVSVVCAKQLNRPSARPRITWESGVPQPPTIPRDDRTLTRPSLFFHVSGLRFAQEKIPPHKYVASLVGFSACHFASCARLREATRIQGGRDIV